MKDINSIICDKLLGVIQKEDEKRLRAWLAESPAHRDLYQRLMKEKMLAHRYAAYNAVNEKEAWRQFKKQNGFKNWRTYVMPVLHYAAVLFIPLVVLVSLWVATRNAHYPLEAQLNQTSSPAGSGISRKNHSPQPNDSSKITAGNSPAKWITLIQHSAGRQNNSLTSSSSSAPASQTKLITLVNGTVVNLTTTDRTSGDTGGKWLTLEDGTKVRLNHSSSLIYPEHFEADNRTVRLEGEGYFMVARDSRRPFYVITPDGTVKEYGTTFNVNTYTPGYTKVVLVEGSISLKSRTGRETMVHPGELAVISANSERATLTPVDVAPYINWNDSQYAFSNTSLADFMNVIGYWYGLEVHFATDAAREKRFSGDIDRRQDLTTLLNAVRKVTKSRIVVHNRNLIIE